MSTYYSTDYVTRFRNAQRQTGTYGSTTRPQDKSQQGGTNTDTFESPRAELIAANESARMWGDPHIDEADGGKYDFHEHGIFNLLEDEGVTLNARLDGDKGGPTYIDHAGLVVNNRKISISNTGKVMINDAENGKDVELKDGQTRQLGDGSFITKNGDTITVSTPEYKMEMQTNKLHEGHRYMDITVSTKEGGVMLDGTKPTGILGETFDKGSSQLTKLKHDEDDYERDSLYETNQTVEVEEPPTPVTPPTPPNNNYVPPYNGNGNPYNGGYTGSTGGSSMAAIMQQFLQFLQQWMQYFSSNRRA